jgi:hypothetical protein
MSSSFVDYYRCPEEFARFAAIGEPGPAPGFFRFGKQITCFGRSAVPVARIADGELADGLSQVHAREDEIALPFDADEILENLRRERYVSTQDTSSLSNKLIKKIYYAARPLLSVGARKHLQQFHLRKRRSMPFPAWPVDKTVDNLCAELMSVSVRANGGQRIPFVWFWPEELMDLDDRHGIRSSFQVVPEERYAVTDSFLESIRSRGFELNVHDLNHDGHLFETRELFLERANKINEYAEKWRVEGFRTGGMYRNAEWTDALQFDYDMSFPNASHLEPQIGGCCTVMPFFAGRLVELPLTATQDYTLFHILETYSIDLWKEELDSIILSNGLATFIVHPDYVIEPRARRVYENLLAHLAELCNRTRLWQPLPRDVARWWRERSQMRVERSSDSWKVVGPGSERARLAFAQLEEGRLTYHVENSPCRESIA